MKRMIVILMLVSMFHLEINYHIGLTSTLDILELGNRLMVILSYCRGRIGEYLTI